MFLSNRLYTCVPFCKFLLMSISPDRHITRLRGVSLAAEAYHSPQRRITRRRGVSLAAEAYHSPQRRITRRRGVILVNVSIKSTICLCPFCKFLLTSISPAGHITRRRGESLPTEACCCFGIFDNHVKI